MIGETTSAGPASTEALTPPEAFVALLIAGARSDGSVSPHEANQIEHVVSMMNLFRGSTLEARHTIFMTAADRIKEQGTDHVVREAVRAIPKELAATTFALAVDLMLSDGRLTTREQRFADELRVALDVDREMTGKIVDVLTIKNAG
jgi:tellurite resistance protein